MFLALQHSPKEVRRPARRWSFQLRHIGAARCRTSLNFARYHHLLRRNVVYAVCLLRRDCSDDGNSREDSKGLVQRQIAVAVRVRAALTFSAMLVLTSASGLTASGSDGTTTRADACTASARPKHKTIDKCFIPYAGIIPFHAADLPRWQGEGSGRAALLGGVVVAGDGCLERCRFEVDFD